MSVIHSSYFSLGYVDSSGLRFYYTSNLRQYDAATLNTGFMVSNFQIVPPNTTDWITVGTCPKNLTEVNTIIA